MELTQNNLQAPEHQPRPTSPLIKPKTHSQILNDSDKSAMKQ